MTAHQVAVRFQHVTFITGKGVPDGVDAKDLSARPKPGDKRNVVVSDKWGKRLPVGVRLKLTRWCACL